MTCAESRSLWLEYVMSRTSGETVFGKVGSFVEDHKDTGAQNLTEEGNSDVVKVCWTNASPYLW